MCFLSPRAFAYELLVIHRLGNAFRLSKMDRHNRQAVELWWILREHGNVGANQPSLLVNSPDETNNQIKL